MVHGFTDEMHPCLNLILECKDLHSCEINSVPRNLNACADSNAKLGQYLDQYNRIVILNDAPPIVKELIAAEQLCNLFCFRGLLRRFVPKKHFVISLKIELNGLSLLFGENLLI